MKLVKKEKIEQDGLHYWDLTIPGTHNYVLSNGVVVHNCGTGVGFSVERTFTDNLPVIAHPTGDAIDYIIQDSTEGWADAVYFGMVQYHLGHRVNWNYSLIRAKGERLHTKGGRASGPEPLKRVLDFAGETIAGAAGRKLKPIEAHDIMCMIAEIVMVGGFRRASLISFSDVEDTEMRDAKDWSKGTFPSIRYMANNSAVYTDRPTEEVFWREWNSLAKSGSGERGFYIVSPQNVAKRGGEFRSNPCVTGDTRVMTDWGMVQIRDLVGKPTKLLLDHRFGTDGIGYMTEVGAFKTGTKEVFRLTTEEGYSLRLTADHRVMTSRGWVEARHLTPSDRIHVTNNGGGFGTKGDENLGMLAGWLAGDGCVLENNTPRFYFYGEKRELTARMALAAQAVTGGALPVSHTYAPADRDTFQSADLREYLGGMTKGRVPEFVWQGTKDCQRGYLSALFSADGCVQGTRETGASVRLSSVESDLLRDVQMLLLNFGVASKLYLNRREAGTRLLPDGNGGLAPYPCQADHELVVSKANLVSFHRNVGFMLASKEAKLKSIVDGFVRGPYAEKFVTRVASVESCGTEDVYDLTEPTTHSFVANGLVVHNCGEILLRFKRANDPWTGAGGGGQFCNLTAAVMRPHDTLETMAGKVHAATWLGVIQSSYTHFPYLRPAWKELCLTGDTRISLLNGKEEKIRDLVGRDGFWVYSYDIKTQKMVPGWAHSVRVTQRDAELVRVTLDSGEFFDCTPNHPVLLKTGEYRQAGSLAAGDSLRPLYRRLSTADDEGKNGRIGYEMVNTGDGWEFTHSLTAEVSNRGACEVCGIGHCGPENHKVLKVERLSHREDVYDLTVDTHHNFALSCGVFVHNCDEDRLVGVDITGQCDNPALSGDEEAMTYLNALARSTAIIAAATLKVNRPAAITCGKPSGNSSQFVDCASGFHTRYAKYYHRHVRISSKDPLYHLVRDQGVPLFKENGQEHLDDDKVDVWVARFPVKSPDGAKLRDHERALQQLERYRQIMRTWCGTKGHNQSATVYVRDEEWQEVGQWLWDHFDEVTGLSFLNYDGGAYRLAPYVEITEEEYLKSSAEMPRVRFDLLHRYETGDMGDGAREAACASGACEV